MLIAITNPIGIFNVSDVKPEFKSTDNFYFETLSNDSINDSISDPINDPINNLRLEIMKALKSYPVMQNIVSRIEMADIA